MTRIEIGSQAVVHHLQHIAVELRRDALRVVVGGHHNSGIGDQTDADQQLFARLEHPVQFTQEGGAFERRQIAQGAAEQGDQSTVALR